MQQRQSSRPDSERPAVAPPASSVSVEIRPVRDRRELNVFIRLPWQLYKGQANWVPPLISERKRHLSRSKNPFFEHAEAEYFLAWRDRRPVDGSPRTSTIA